MKFTTRLASIALALPMLMGVVFSLPGGTNMVYSFTAPGWQSQTVMRVGGCIANPTTPSLLTVECDDSRAVPTFGPMEDPDAGHADFSRDVIVSAQYSGSDWSTDCRVLYDGVLVNHDGDDAEVGIDVEGP